MTGGRLESAPRYATDITADDAWAVYEFVMPRLDALLSTHDAGSEQHRIAEALAEALATLVLRLDTEILRPTRKPHPIRPATLSPPVWTEEQLRAAEERRRDVIHQSWDDLCALVRPWQGSEGYDEVRWRMVDFRDAARETYYDRTCAELAIALRAERP
ncbi:hypothetical protein [Streptomyces sp. ISL-94]|uniref:hypothetical protein n=1 Tax=Streptomyces sp. ISL-94 TaxID=2819190 RepID=UPI001BE5FADC|nr:hypothetical protein [Streptomyces sp. ISL-94]MBT2478126.1 hypothetical protein [Streptomyces sp. ISL-94]